AGVSRRSSSIRLERQPERRACQPVSICVPAGQFRPGISPLLWNRSGGKDIVARPLPACRRRPSSCSKKTSEAAIAQLPALLDYQPTRQLLLQIRRKGYTKLGACVHPQRIAVATIKQKLNRVTSA